MSASRVAMHDDTVVGMGLLGVRQQRGWIGGMGVVPHYRRQGAVHGPLPVLSPTGLARSLSRLGARLL